MPCDEGKGLISDDCKIERHPYTQTRPYFHCVDRAARAAQMTPNRDDALCAGRRRTGFVHQAAAVPQRCHRADHARLHCLETSRHVMLGIR